MPYTDAYFAVQSEQVQDYWMMACDNININSYQLCEFEDKSGRYGFPPSEYFPRQKGGPDVPNETPPYKKGIFDKIPNGSEKDSSGTDWTRKMDGLNKVVIIHARLPNWLYEKAKVMPEYIGTSAQDVRDAFNDDFEKTVSYTDPDTGKEVEYTIDLLNHEWR